MEDAGKVVNTEYNIPGIGTYHTAYILRLRAYKSGEDGRKEEYNRVSHLVIDHWKFISSIVGDSK